MVYFKLSGHAPLTTPAAETTGIMIIAAIVAIIIIMIVGTVVEVVSGEDANGRIVGMIQGCGWCIHITEPNACPDGWMDGLFFFFDTFKCK